jgi:dTDP-4-amino-4,6-dideoxygalactose transaminase
MVLTNDESLGVLVRQLRNHGESSRYVHERVGGNFRLDTMKAAVLLVKLRKLEDFLARRRSNAARYNALLADTPVQTPWTPEHQRHVYHQYSILTDRRDELAAYLRGRGVDTGIYYAVGLHLQRCFSSLGYRPGSLPVTERVSDRILSLPCHPMVTDEDVRRVASCVNEFHTVPSGPCREGADARLKETAG